MGSHRTWACLVGFCLSVLPLLARADQLPRVDERFAELSTEEVPDFQRHVVPLLGRLGCNGRACHGSFQGQGGFRLSLFGYDFQADHEALLDRERFRVDVHNPQESLVLIKPTSEDDHGGGLRYEKGSWQHHLLRKWIEGGARFDRASLQELQQLEVTPADILFRDRDEQLQLRVIAVWEDGTREDVTPLCRFQTNNDQIATVSETGQVRAADAGDTHVVVFYDKAVVPIPVLRPVSHLAGAQYPDVLPPTPIDELVVAKLRDLGIVPSELCSDADFLRRLRLDLTGTLPTAAEVEQFLADSAPDKRQRKIDELLDSPAYAAWWTTRLCDYTGNNDFQLQNTLPLPNQASRDWYNWIYQRVEANAPYDELVEGIVMAVSRQEGQSYLEYCEQMSQIYRGGSEQTFADLPSMPHFWARREFRQPDERAIGFAYAFLGIRIQCAQCHKHPFDQWSKEDFEQFSNLFRQVRFSNAPAGRAREDYNQLLEQLDVKGQPNNQLRRQLPELLKEGKTIPFPEVAVQPMRPNRRNNRPAANNASITARLLGGEAIQLADYRDPREALMQWMRDPANPYFARAFVNRVWANYFGTGIVDPPDDLSLANPPSNKPLLDYLSEGFVASGYDMKWLHREIVSSRTYQLSWQPNDTNRHDTRNFSRAVPRRLPAEVAYDAIQLATASNEDAVRMQHELEGRAIAIPGAGGRNRNNGPNFALTVFGRSLRESNCDCDRSSDASLLQTIFLQNDQDVLRMIDRREGWINELRPQFGRSRSAQGEPNERLEEAIAGVERRLQAAKRRGQEDAVARLEAQLQRLQARAERLAERQDAQVAEDRAPVLDLDGLVQQAYLRTLSRYPRPDESAIAREYLTAAANPVDGARDLLWALLNTKEFIVNH